MCKSVFQWLILKATCLQMVQQAISGVMCMPSLEKKNKAKKKKHEEKTGK
jgi:hypothetical protein